MAGETRVERMHAVLRTIRSASADIIGSAILTSDGFVVASILPSEVDEELIAGMTATLLGVGERISAEMMGSDLQQIYVSAKTGYVVLNQITDTEVLVVLTTREAKLGLVFMEVRKRVGELAKLM